MEILTNKIQTPVEELKLDKEPEEIQEQFYDYINNVPYLKRMISPDRKYAKDLERDDEGKIIIDITQPHILENMDYFRPSAIHFQKYGCYTNLKPNKNPNSEYGKWIRTEIRRCWNGYVRKSDGEWITGDMYFFLNYCPIQLTKKDKKGKTIRTLDFPRVWDGHYYKSHYLNQCRNNGKHAMELASRGRGKSFFAAAMLAKRFILGESEEVKKKVQCVATASERKYIQGANQLLDMFQYYIDHCAKHTQFPKRRSTSSLQNLQWTMGYVDAESNVKRGSENSVIGITSKDDESKLRGSRGVLYLLEESGTFPRLLNLYSVLRPSVEDGNQVWGLIFAYGTAGDNESDFSAMQELMYNPRGYNIQELNNVYDKEGQGRPYFTFFYPGYMNMSDCYDNNGNSDVTKALLVILKDRYKVKYNSTDVNAIAKRISEIPITPQEAILKARGNMFPITQLNERLSQIDADPHAFDDIYVGTLFMNSKGIVEFKISSDSPIREYPLKDNKAKGAIEIFQMPEKDSSGQVNPSRYIIGHDPVDNDSAESMSLTSTFVLDLFTDKIVAEYTGRQDYADDNFEIVRLLCLFYNGKCLYEQNKKGIFAYFSRLNCLHLLADVPTYLKDKQLIKTLGYGNTSKGVNATLPINNFANGLIRDWLLKPVPTVIKENDEDKEILVSNLYFIKNRALLKELILFNSNANFDRVRALGMVMLYREEKMILYQNDISKISNEKIKNNSLSNDAFFTVNYDNRFKNSKVSNINI